MTEEAKQKTIALLDREWNDLDAWLRSLSESDLDRRVFGEDPGWRVRDMIPHFAWWQELAARVAEKIATEGGAPDERGSRPFVGITTTLEEQNAETYKAWRDRPLADRWKRWLEAHTRMMAALRKLRPEQLLKADGPEGMQPYFAMPGLIHLRLHRADIEASLKETATK